MKCSIISIGNEILSGVTLDTNSLIISKKLESIGLRIHKKESVADDISDILYSLKSNISNNDILIITGGLGPTSDDKTKEALCLFFNDNLVKSNLVLKDISSLFKNSKYDSKQLLKLEQNQKQALVPSKSGSSILIFFWLIILISLTPFFIELSRSLYKYFSSFFEQAKKNFSVLECLILYFLQKL